MIPIAISPCPNDTFLFDAWIHEKIGHLKITPTFADVEQLNHWALEQKYPLMKVSMYCLASICKDYVLLPVGCTLGEGCGPKLISKERFRLEDISSKRVAIPGEHTTAHLLFDTLLSKPKAKHFCLYHEMGKLLEENCVDCAVIIHESRFTFQEQGYFEIADLGSLWERRFDLPLPLGGIVAHRSLSDPMIHQMVDHLKASLLYAKKDPLSSQAFILTHSQEKAPEVIERFLKLYVTNETQGLSAKGVKAIQTLLECCDLHDDPLTKSWLWSQKL